MATKKSISTENLEIEDQRNDIQIKKTESGYQNTIDTDIEKALLQDTIGILETKNEKTVSKEQLKQVIDRLKKTKEISFNTAMLSTATLIRRGASSAGAADTMQVEVKCPETNISTAVSRYDLGMALHAITGHRTIRKLAEALAPEMLSANIKLIETNPMLDLKGDLANKINSKLMLKKEDPLTRKEEICCCTYAQWLPNLNEFAESKRLKALLEEDLLSRRRSNKKKTKKQKQVTTNKKLSPVKKSKQEK
jgi:hypothetical protein